jgi:hypothetical protein
VYSILTQTWDNRVIGKIKSINQLKQFRVLRLKQ